MNSQLAFADFAIIVGFFAVMLAVGLYFSTRMRDLQDYFSGGRRVPWWLSGISLYMSAFSAFTFVAYSALAYQYGWVAVTVSWTTVPAMILSAYFFGPRWRRANSASPLEYIQTRYGNALRQGLAWLGIPMTVIDDGLKLFAIGTLVSTGLGLQSRVIGGVEWNPLDIAIVGSGLVMLSYTFLGGLWAVLVTDFVQFIVMIAAVLVLVPLAYTRVGGWDTFMEGVPETFFRATQDPSDPKATYTWIYLVAFLVIMILGYCSRWSFVQRYYSVRTDAEARKVGYLVAFLSFIGPPLLFFPAMAASVFMPGIEDANEVYMLLCKELLPVGMIGMIIAAMFSATLSMLSSDYNAVAAVMTNDVYRPLFAPNASDKNLVFVGRISTLLVGVIALGLGLFVADAQGEGDLFQLMARLFGVFLPPIAIPMLAGLVTSKVSHAGGFLGFFFGIVVGLAAYFLAEIPVGAGETINLRYVPILTSLTTASAFLGLWLGTVFAPNSSYRKTEIDLFLSGIGSTAPDAVDETLKAANVTPGPVIGVSVAALGLLVVGVTLVTVPLSEAGLTLGVGTALAVVGAVCWLLSKKNTVTTEVSD